MTRLSPNIYEKIKNFQPFVQYLAEVQFFMQCFQISLEHGVLLCRNTIKTIFLSLNSICEKMRRHKKIST